MKPLIIIGAGAHVTVVLDVLHLMGRHIVGICDPKLVNDESYQGIPIILEEQLEKISRNEIELVNAIGSTRSLNLRKIIFEKFKRLGFTFASLVHPSAILASKHNFGEGVQIMAGVVIQPRAVIGSNTLINTRAIIEHDCHIGASVHIAPGVILCGGVKVAAETHIGAGAVVIQCISIGESVLVGANCTVLSNVADNAKMILKPA